MCTINKLSSHNQRATQTIVLDQIARRQEQVPVNKSKPATCAHCNTIHYHYQLACRKCGAYFLPAETMQAKLQINALTATVFAILGLAAGLLMRGF